jgi:uncharacterized protein (TIGR02646 family)
MIKINKDLSSVPLSLDERKTNRKRENCIKDRKYHYKKDFDQRYKQRDVKDALVQLYHQKCAFCEQKILECRDHNLEDCTQTIEHYRPKSSYYWLAFSWDNLLLCCHRCNQNKGSYFEIDGSFVNYEESFHKSIHTSISDYQELEKPKMIHPEIDTVLDKLQFKNGIIGSDDERVKYTIKTCQLDRENLNEKRKTILQNFLNKVNANREANRSIGFILKDLIGEFKEEKNEFRALRYWMLKNYQLLIS